MEDSLNLSYTSIKDSVLRFDAGKAFIGSLEIQPALLSVLKDQAYSFKTTQLYEVLIATIQDEAMRLALIQSTKWEDVNYAKALWHVQFVLDNIINTLGKK